jgi:gentisate 1,2-dioxygenase
MTADSLDELFDEAVVKHAQPLWPVLGNLSPETPTAKAVPYTWRYADLRPFCERAARLVGTDLAERRVFMLVNPALKAPYTTDTLYAGLQTILPGEVARAHRHTPFALRFIIEGERGFTAVEGEKVMMERGDMVLTPPWEWHDHGNEGSIPMIWLDGLDLPLWQTLPAIFTEQYAGERYPSALGTPGGSNRKYPWIEMQAKLDMLPGPSAEARYRLREGGGEVGLTCGAGAYRIDAGASTPPLRETASAVIHVFEGRGHTVFDDGTTLEWTRGDTFVLPAWRSARMKNLGTERAYLFRFDDRPLITAIGAYRSERPGEHRPGR